MLLLALVSKQRGVWALGAGGGPGLERRTEVLWSLLPLPVGAGGREAMGLGGEMLMESLSLTSLLEGVPGGGADSALGIAGSARQEWV